MYFMQISSTIFQWVWNWYMIWEKEFTIADTSLFIIYPNMTMAMSGPFRTIQKTFLMNVFPNQRGILEDQVCLQRM